MRIDPKEPVLIVRAEIFGGGRSRIVDMALDTGATYTMIPWKVVESLGYEPALSEKRTSVVTTSTIEVVPLITMECIKVLGVKADNVDVACHDLPPKSRTEGLLGLSFLNRFNIDLHFKKRTLEIKDP